MTTQPLDTFGAPDQSHPQFLNPQIDPLMSPALNPQANPMLKPKANPLLNHWGNPEDLGIRRRFARLLDQADSRYPRSTPVEGYRRFAA